MAVICWTMDVPSLPPKLSRAVSGAYETRLIAYGRPSSSKLRVSPADPGFLTRWEVRAGAGCRAQKVGERSALIRTVALFSHLALLS